MIYKPAPTSEEPELEIQQWSIRQVPDGDRHIVGIIPTSGHDGRVTSKIMKTEGRTITTRSGRKYHLSGHPGSHSNGEYVWAAWCVYNRIDPAQTIDVTNQYTDG